MLQVAYPNAKSFSKELAAIYAAYLVDRNHSLLISKRPNDIFCIDEIRLLYSRRRPSVRFVLTTRDPRAVLTSRHPATPDDYYVEARRWQAIYALVRANAHRDDCHIVRFEDLVTRVNQLQADVASFIGIQPQRQFDRFQEFIPEGFQQTALNGLRALDSGVVNKWREPLHQNRIRSLLREIPTLPEALIELGYESDEDWIRGYLT